MGEGRGTTDSDFGVWWQFEMSREEQEIDV